MNEQANLLQAKEIESARLHTELKSLHARKDELETEVQAATDKLTESEIERTRITERLESQAAQFASEKTTIQKHLHEYKERLETTTDEGRKADIARRKAEKDAVEGQQRASAAEQENRRLGQELTEVKNETRLLTEKLGEIRGQLNSSDERLIIEKKGFETLLDEKNQRLVTLQKSLDESKALVRQYLPKNKAG